MISARELARRVLRRVRRDRAYASLTLSAALAQRPALVGAERALATELVYGVLRHRRLLDHALARHSHRPLAKVDPDTLDALRVAAYQVLLLDRVPAHAAVDEAVGAVRLGRGREVAGYANAVLRRLEPLDLEADLPGGDWQRLAVQCSLPDWLARHWAAQLGHKQARALARSLLQPAPLAARVNTLRGDAQKVRLVLQAEGARAEPGALSPDALLLQGLAGPFSLASYLDGLWTAQDEGAQLVSHLVAPRPGQTVLDACAGVGGKATHLAALMEDRGCVLCLDRSARKLELLREHCLRLGVSGCETREVDLLQPGATEGMAADLVLLDAPCSGLGVLRRHPELKWREEEGERTVARMAELQRNLLAQAATALRPGGVLVYSVCSTTEQEGRGQVRWLQQRFSDLGVWPPDTVPFDRLAGADGTVQLWPHEHGTDGFFMARLRRS